MEGVSQLNINSWLAGAIKLLFRKLNSILCERVRRFAPAAARRSDKKIFN
jgi:hypothetical protein